MDAQSIDSDILQGAAMLRDLFAKDAPPAIQRRIAWAFDCARIDEVMYWLSVLEAMCGIPLLPISMRPRTS